MSMYIVDSVEALLYEVTGQCDLVRRKIMTFLGGKEDLRIRTLLHEEWKMSIVYSDDDIGYIDDDFYPFDREDSFE